MVSDLFNHLAVIVIGICFYLLSHQPQSYLIEKILQKRQLPYYRASEDGNCFYRCLSKDIYGTADYHLDVRQRICKAMAAKPHFYQNFLTNRITFDKLIKYHSRDGNHANHECY